MSLDKRKSTGKKDIPTKRTRLPKRCPSLNNICDPSSVVKKVRLNSNLMMKNGERLPLKRRFSGDDLAVSCPDSWGALRLAIAEIAHNNDIAPAKI